MGYVTLESGGTVQLRRTTRADLEPLLGFFAALPAHERRYLRRDVTDTAVVDALLREAERGGADRLVAILDGAVAGYGALIFEDEDWHRHLGELRVIVAERFRNRRLATHLVRALVDGARERGLSRVVAKMPAAQDRVRKMFERMGFRIDAVLPEHVVDGEGKLQDLVVMSCSLDDVSRVLREFCRDDDWMDG